MAVKTKRTKDISVKKKAAKRKLRAGKTAHTLGTVDRQGKRIKAVKLRPADELTEV